MRILRGNPIGWIVRKNGRIAYRTTILGIEGHRLAGEYAYEFGGHVEIYYAEDKNR